MNRFSAQIAFSAEGDQLNAFRDALRTEHLSCSRQQIRNGVFYGRISANYWYALAKLAKEFEITLTVLERKGLRFRLFPYRFRFGLLAGLCLGIAFLWWSNQTIRSIEIYGNEQISDTRILTALESLGVARGTQYRKMDFDLLEQQLRLVISDIEWVTLQHTGGRLIVDLREETDPPERYADRIPTNYIATVSAQITDIRVLGGEALVKVGDAVKEGDVLISGVIEDKRGLSYFKHGDGVVTGIYEEDLLLEQPFCEETTVTGETITNSFLECFGKRFPIQFGMDTPDEPFVYTETQKPLKLFGLIFPFALVQGHYSRQETTIAVYSAAEIMAMQEEQADRFEQNFHANDQILAKDYAQTVTDLGISLKIHYVFEGVIGKTSEIFVKKT